MNTRDNQKVRLSVDCTEQERRYIKMLAAKKGKSISEYLLSFARKEMPKKAKHTPRVPNKRTKKALKEAEEESGETYDTIDEFWEAMGINPNED